MLYFTAKVELRNLGQKQWVPQLVQTFLDEVILNFWGNSKVKGFSATNRWSRCKTCRTVLYISHKSKSIRGCCWFCTGTLQCWGPRSWSWWFHCTEWRWWSTGSLVHCGRSRGNPGKWRSLIWLWTFLCTRQRLGKGVGLKWTISLTNVYRSCNKGYRHINWLFCLQFREGAV